MNILLLLLAVSIFCLGYGLWLGWWDLHPVRPNAAASSTALDHETPICDRPNLRLAVGCSLLLHAGIVGVLLLVGDIPPGVSRFPGRDPAARAKDFYVFLASPPEEEKHPSKASRTDNLEKPLRAALPTLPALTATRVAPWARMIDPGSQRPAPVQVAADRASKKGGPSTPAVEARHEASPEVEKQRRGKSSQAQSLTRVAENLERVQSLPSLGQDAGPEPSHARSGAMPPASQVVTNPAPVPMPGGSAAAPTQVATRLTSKSAFDPPRTPVPDGPALVAPPGIVVGELLATSTSPMDNKAPDRRAGTSLSLPLVTAAARSTAPEPPGHSRDTHSVEAQTPEPAPAAEPAKQAGPPSMPQADAPTSAFFPSPGTMVAAPDATVPLPVQRTARHVPAPKSAGPQQEIELAKVEAPRNLAISPKQEARSRAPFLKVSPSTPEGQPVADRVPITGPSPEEPKDVQNTRFGSVSPSGPPAISEEAHSSEEQMREVLAAAEPVQEAARERLASTDPSLQGPGEPLADSKVSSAAARSPMLDPKEGREGSQLAEFQASDVRPALPAHETPSLLEESSTSGKGIQGLEEDIAQDLSRDGLDLMIDHPRAADNITIKYVPPPVPNGIAITSPQDGYSLLPDTPPVILVEGQVEDWDVSTVWLVANDRRIAVRSRNGRFRKVLPLLEPVLHLGAELPPNGGPPRRSRVVTVRVPSPSRSHGLLLMDWPEGVVGNRVEVEAAWRASPQRLDVPIRRVPMKVFGAPPKDVLPEAFTFRTEPGVYTFVLRGHAMSASGVRVSLILPEGDHLKARELRPVSLNGTGGVVLAKVLLPQGVLWGDDEWFTGQSESADSVTKFRFPEGISWTERKKDLP